MKFVKLLSYTFLFILLLSGCTLSTKDKLVGTWTVDINDTIIENNKWYNFTSNMLIFESDSTFFGMTFFDIGKQRSLEAEGKWIHFSNNNMDYVILNIPNNPMNGKYQVTFYKDYEKKLLKIRMKSDSIEFTAGKFLQDFDKNEDW